MLTRIEHKLMLVQLMFVNAVTQTVEPIHNTIQHIVLRDLSCHNTKMKPLWPR